MFRKEQVKQQLDHTVQAKIPTGSDICQINRAPPHAAVTESLREASSTTSHNYGYGMNWTCVKLRHPQASIFLVPETERHICFWPLWVRGAALLLCLRCPFSNSSVFNASMHIRLTVELIQIGWKYGTASVSLSCSTSVQVYPDR